MDVGYHKHGATAAAVAFADWSDPLPAREWTVEIDDVAEYVPGSFYLRELPCLLELLQAVPTPATLLVDGYVWLDGQGRRGLGAHLYEALDGKIPVIGVAKTSFNSVRDDAGTCGDDQLSCQEVVRGVSRRPLFVTAVGVALATAAVWVASMHGAHRVPTLLKRVDQLSRRPKRA